MAYGSRHMAALRHEPYAISLQPLAMTPRHDDPHVRSLVPYASLVVAEDRLDPEPCTLELSRHLGHRQCAKDQLETMIARAAVLPLHIALLEGGEAAAAVLPHRFDQREIGPTRSAAQLHLVGVLAPLRDVRYEIDPETSAALDDTSHRRERRREISRFRQRLQDAVRRQHHGKGAGRERQGANISADQTPATRAREHRRRSIDAD